MREPTNAADEGLEPEGSLPLSGFSRDLRQAPDAERFRFSFALRGEMAFPVHILYSRAARAAEVGSSDLKVYRMSDVDSPAHARSRWIEWWQKASPRRSRGSSPIVPRRIGRLPPSPVARRPRPAMIPAP
jgi:hypothetical protein